MTPITDWTGSTGHLLGMTYSTDSILMELLRSQHGLARTRQAHDLGVPDHRIKLMVRDGRLRRLSYGIIAAPGVPESDDFRSMYGVLLGGHGLKGIGSALCGPSAAWRQELIRTKPEKIHVLSSRRLKPLAGYAFHDTGRLPTEEIKMIDGVPTTDAIRTFLDLCHIERWKAKGAYYRALRDGCFTPEAAQQRIEKESRQGRQGLTLAREIVLGTSPGAERARSSWEEEVMRWIIDASLPLPERNVLIPSSFGFMWEIDMLYRTPPTAIEISPWDIHGDPRIYLKDIRKREDLEKLGYKVIVVADLADRPHFLSALGERLGISGA